METATSTAIAITKRMATNEIGGKSRSPILIASHVELHTMQSTRYAVASANFVDCFGIAYQRIADSSLQINRGRRSAMAKGAGPMCETSFQSSFTLSDRHRQDRPGR